MPIQNRHWWIGFAISFCLLWCVQANECIENVHLGANFNSCQCNKLGVEKHISLHCEGQRWITVPAIQKALVGDKRKQVHIAAISMKNGLLMYVGQDAFRNTSAQTIDLSRNYIENVNANAFRGLEDQLYQILLNQNSLFSIPHHSLTYLSQLRYLYLQQNQISEIPHETFMGRQLKNLKYLHLDKNKITILQKGSLTNVPLQVLTLSNNRIAEIEKQSLPPTLWFLDLKHNLLRKIPYLALRELKNLRTLDLESNNITVVEAHEEARFESEVTLLLGNNKLTQLANGAFDSFSNISKLDLSYNQISKIHEQAFRAVKALGELDLSYNSIVHIPIKTFETIGKTLRKLNLEENDLHALPTGLRTLHSLEMLNLNSNKLADIENSIVYTFKRNLTELLLAFNRLTTVPHDVLEGMDKLKHLDISKNRIKTLDDSVFPRLPNLIRINLAGNQLTKITNHHLFDTLGGLAYLDLSYNRIHQLGKVAFEKLIGLESLFLQNNELKEFPRNAFLGLQKLRYLLLDHNEITSLPNFAFQWLVQLERFSISRNKIKAIDEKTFRAGPMQLRSLNLGFNQISRLSTRAFDSLPSLEQLFLNNNGISKIQPQTFTTLKNLRVLSLAHNKIQEISEYAFVNLPSLEHLTLRKNNLNGIPKRALASVPKLEVLDLSSNRITTFSTDFLETSEKLSVLDLSENQISSFQIENLKQTLQQLSLSNNKLEYLGGRAFDGFRDLTFLDLSRNELIKIEHNCFHSSPQLEVINLSHNTIKKLWKETFSKQKRIRQLHLSNNFLDSIDYGVFGRNNVLELFLNHNNFTSIPHESLTSIRQSLTTLDLSNNNVKSLERKDLVGMQNITRLILSHNGIESIDDEAFADLPLIKHLDLSNNPITTWSPHAFKSISQSLYSMNLAHTGLFSIPKVNSRGLQHLNISHNKIYEIQNNDIDLLRNVKVFDASWNNLADIRPDILKKMPELKFLDINGNKMRELHEEQLRYLDQLETLRMAHLEHLTELPDSYEFAKLRNLKELEIHTIPNSHSQYNISHILQVLPPLKTIDIEIVDEELNDQLKQADLRLLRTITIRGNKLKRIATSALEKLRGYRIELTIRDTKIQTVPPLVFNTITSISFLSLSLVNNRIYTLNLFTHTKPPLLNPHGTILEYLDLSNNPVMCSCEMQWLAPWIEYTVEHSQMWSRIGENLDATECDARPGIQDTLLSVYGSKVPGVTSKHEATLDAQQMCARHSSAPRVNVIPMILPILVMLVFW